MKKNIVLISALLICLSLMSCETSEDKFAKAKLEVKKLEQLRVAQSHYEKSLETLKVGKVKRGQGFFQALRSVSIIGRDSLQLINKLRDKVEFSKLKVGDKLVAKFNQNHNLVEFSFSNNPAEKHNLKKNFDQNSWDYTFEEEDTFWKTRIITGKLKVGSTLQTDLVEAGLKRSVVGEIVNILLCKVHFRMDARMGDDYNILLNERLYRGQILETKILYTSYKGKRAGFSEAYFYDDGDQKSTYTAHYTEDGEALIRSGLRYPVKRLHIRSGYGRRRHPVTGRSAMHRGVDLRARTGTPVHAVARGVVIQSKLTPLGGNKIAIRHTDNSISYYLHLHKRFVKTGTRVKSFQVIGQVGATGRVTGAHLHFGFKKSNGRWMNPMHKRMIATPKLKGKKFERLTKQIAHTKAVLSKTQLSQVSQARLPANKHNEI